MNDMSRSRWKRGLDSAASVAVIVVAAALLWRIVHGTGTNPPPPPGIAIPSAPVPIEGRIVIGQPTAPIAVIEFSDFECPFCAAFAREVMPKLNETFIRPGLVQLVFRNLPLPMHKHGVPAARASECAAEQGRFQELHDVLFAHQKALEDTDLDEYVDVLKLDKTQYQICLSSRAVARVGDSVRQAGSLKISGTPAFLIGTVDSARRVRVESTYPGVPNFKTLGDALNELVKKSRSRPSN